MKKKIKVISLFMTTLIFGVLALTGCGKVEKADVTAEALYELYIHGDSAKIEEMALTKDEADKVINQVRDSLKNQTRTSFLGSGINIEDSKLDEIIDAQLNAHKKLTCSVELVSEEKDSAEVKITTNYIDIQKLDEDAANDAQTQVKGMGLTSQLEARKKLVEVYENNIIDYFSKAEPSSEKVEETFKFTKQKFEVKGKAQELWMPEDMNKFGENLGRMITNNK